MVKLTQAMVTHHRQLLVMGSLLLSTALCLVMLLTRVWYARELHHVNLAWNLFLAWLPMLIAWAAYNLYKRDSWFSWLVITACAGLWLLFFPNAPYMVTDIIHLWSRGDGVPLWYDLILIVAFAWTSFFLGLVSLFLMQTLVRRAAGPFTSWLFALGVLVLSGFGVYLGRFERWNSWDLFTAPRSLLAEIYRYVRHPLDHPQAVVFSVLFAGFCLCAYLMLVALTHLPREAHNQLIDDTAPHARR